MVSGVKKIKTFKIFSNMQENAIQISTVVKNELIKNGFTESESAFDLAIAVGGDGSFLHMVKQCNFDSNIYYVGVNAGTLGFLQEIKPEEIAEFVTKIKSNYFKVEQTGIQETDVIFGGGKSKFFSLNEIVVRDGNLKTAHFKVFIGDVLLENFTGDGLLISTSCGSTAYNLSFGGSIVYNDLHTLQITPIAPLNSKAYKTLTNSVIVPEDRVIKLLFGKQNLHVVIDGQNMIFEDVECIQTKTSNKKINILRLSMYDYTKVINEKF